MISCDDQIAQTFSEYFINSPSLNGTKYSRMDQVKFAWSILKYFVPNLPSHGRKCPDSLEPNSILRILDKNRNHQSVKLIKAKNNSRVSNFAQKTLKK